MPPHGGAVTRRASRPRRDRPCGGPRRDRASQRGRYPPPLRAALRGRVHPPPVRLLDVREVVPVAPTTAARRRVAAGGVMGCGSHPSLVDVAVGVLLAEDRLEYPPLLLV